MTLLAQHPRNRIHHVRLPAPIRPHDASSPRPAKRHHRPLAERLKAHDLHFSQLKQDVPFCPSSHSQSQPVTPPNATQRLSQVPVGAQPASRQALLRHKHKNPTVQEKPIFLSLGKKVRRRISDRYAVARKNVWQVLDQSPAAWRVNGGTGKNTNTNRL